MVEKMNVKYPDLQQYIDTHYRPENVEKTVAMFSCASVMDDRRCFGAATPPMPAPMVLPSVAAEPKMEAAAVFPATTQNAKDKPEKTKEEHGFLFHKKEKAGKAAPHIADESAVCEEALEESFEEDSNQDYDALLEELKEKLDERQKHLADSFSEYLLHLIEVKGMQNVEVYKAAAVDKKLFAKIKNDLDYHPQKLTCLCLCIGAKCNLDEAKDLLSRAGYAFSPSDMRDVIFQYFIEKKIYDIFEIDLQLEEYGVPGIIA